MAALDLAIKALHPMDGSLVTKTATGEVPLLTVAKTFEEYIAAPNVEIEATRLSFHDGDVEHHEQVIETRSDEEDGSLTPCRRCGVKRADHNEETAGHRFEEQLAFDGVETKVDKPKPIVDNSICAITACKRQRDHYVHLQKAIGNGGHEFVERL